MSGNNFEEPPKYNSPNFADSVFNSITAQHVGVTPNAPGPLLKAFTKQLPHDISQESLKILMIVKEKFVVVITCLHLGTFVPKSILQDYGSKKCSGRLCNAL